MSNTILLESKNRTYLSLIDFEGIPKEKKNMHHFSRTYKQDTLIAQ